jgi:hypothetical protein
MKNALSILAASLALTALAGTISPTITDVTLSDRQVTHIHYGNGTAGGELCWQANVIAGHYMLDDNAATTVVLDSGPSQLNGTAVANTSTFSISAVDGTGLGGAAFSVGLGTAFNFDGSSPFSVALWARGTDQGQRYVGSKPADSSAPGWIFWRWDSNIYLNLNAGTVWTANELQCYTPVSDYSSWHHYAATYDGSKTAAGVTFYRDGAPLATFDVQSDTLTGDATSPYQVAIGGSQYGVEIADGGFDDVRIYTRVLTTNDVATLFGTYDPPPPPATVTIYFDAGYEGYPEYGSAEFTPGSIYGSLPYCYPNAGYENYYFGYWRDADWNYVDTYSSTVPASSTTLYAVWYY